jgi:hypothetical protein
MLRAQYPAVIKCSPQKSSIHALRSPRTQRNFDLLQPLFLSRVENLVEWFLNWISSPSSVRVLWLRI